MAAYTAVTGIISRESSTDKSQIYLRVTTAIAYAVSSFLIVVVNKTVLTSHKFPSFLFLANGQIIATLVIVYLAKKLRLVSFPDYSKDTVIKIWPLPLIFLGNLICGLGSTKQLSLPMFTVLRRFSILMTLIAEYYILGVKKSRGVQLAVFGMVGGAIIAAMFDLSYDTLGYFFVLSNNLFTAANGVYAKQKLQSKDFGEFGVMYYNSLFMLLPVFFLTFVTGDLTQAMEFDKWSDNGFLVQFLLSCIMGCLLSYCTLMCTKHNSPLTTTIVGSLKNIGITYAGMYLGGDYVFNLPNWLGINISVLSSILYSYLTFSGRENAIVKPLPPEERVTVA